jgi:hypothetical protein
VFIFWFIGGIQENRHAQPFVSIHKPRFLFNLKFLSHITIYL